MVVDDLVVCGAEPLFMTDYMVFGGPPPERVGGHRGRRGRGLRAGRLRPDRRGDGRASRAFRAGRLRPGRRGHRRGRCTTTCSARTGCSPATWCSRWAPPGCTPTATRWSGRCWSGPAWTWRPSSAELGRPARRRAAHADPHLRPGLPGPGRATATCTPSPTSPAAGWPPTWPGCCPPEADAVLDRATWRPPAVFGLLAERGGVPPGEMERVFNMGVGMAAVVGPRRCRPGPRRAGRAAASRRGCSARSCPAQARPA